MTEVLEKVFKTVPNEPSSPTSNTLFQRPRSHANELAIAAAILPVASSNPPPFLHQTPPRRKGFLQL